MKLWPHQRAAVDFARSRDGSIIAAQMGCGKSAIALALNDEEECKRTLVVCPTSVRAVWRGQIAKHARRDIEALILDTGSIAKRTLLANQVWYSKSKRPFIIVINYEAAWREPFRSWCLWKKWDLAILDESKRCMRESKTAMFCNELRTRSARRMALDGTPLTQCPISVWAQARFCDPTVFGDDLEAFKWRYENRYAIGCRKAVAKLNDTWIRDTGEPFPVVFPEWMLGSIVNTEDYLARLSRIAYRVENVVLDLPPLTVEKRTCKLSDTARRLYDAIQNGHIDEIETGRWVHMEKSYATTMRLQQITSGFLPDAEGNPITVDDGKAQCLEDILGDAGEPVVVFTRFVHDLDTTRDIAIKLGLRYGEISHRSKNGLSNTGTMPDWCDVVGVQEQAGGAGIDLTRARIAVFYSLAWSVADYDQALARVYRPPQARPVVVYQLVAEQSIDEDIYRALRARRDVIKLVWGGLAALSSPASSPASDKAGSAPRY